MMSGIQGIIVCGEASESEEEEEFCAVQAFGQKASEAQRNNRPLSEHKPDAEVRQPVQNELQRRKASTSLLHQKLWETNTSLETNLSKTLQEPLVKKTSQMATLITSIPAAQTSTLLANAAFTQVTLNLSHLNVLLQGLRHINTFDTLKSQSTYTK